MPQTFFRIVKHAMPSRSDFLSNAALGRTPARPLSPTQAAMWEGLSVFDCAVHARRQACDRSWLGSFIAEISIGDQIEATWKRTNPVNPGHYTLWADPDDLFVCIVRIDPVN